MEIEIYTMEPGHTKFSPDQHFESVKNSYNSREKIETFEDCLEVATQSSNINKVIDLKEKKLKIYEWDNYLATLYDKCKAGFKIFD